MFLANQQFISHDFLICRPSQRSACSQVPSQVATHQKIGSQLWAGETLGTGEKLWARERAVGWGSQPHRRCIPAAPPMYPSRTADGSQPHRRCPAIFHQLHLKLYVDIVFATAIISAINNVLTVIKPVVV